ncbi:MAG: MotA/TolQ/ExbB proton channel family protein [Luteolibacter sp.]|jgi:biopolymer transport protein ExbB
MIPPNLQRLLVVAGMLTFSIGVMAEQDAAAVAAALDKARAERVVAMRELDTVRAGISDEKPARARQFAEVELELREKRRLARIARTSEADRDAEIRQLERDRATRRQDAFYLAGLLKEHALRTDTLSTPGQAQLDVPSGTLSSDPSDPALALVERLPVIDAAIDQLESLLGGSTRPGRAATLDGEILDGTFAAAGPVSWFASADGRTAGEALRSRNGEIPRIHPAPAAPIVALTRGIAANIGIDVTGGKAMVLAEVEGGFLTLIRKGGLWIWPILFLATLSFAFGCVKFLVLMRIREPGEAWINAILTALRTSDTAKAADLARSAAHPVGPVLEKLIEVSGQPADQVEETLYEQLMGVQSRAGSLLPVIAVTAATSPLLGLLGTVSGMIATFNLITVFGSGDPKPLAGGISEALVTTLFGLIVAIPALILHAFLSRRAQGIVQTTERLGLAFVNGLRSR